MSDAPLRVAYWGNFEPEYSTENDYARAWRNNGHDVSQIQEGEKAEVNSLVEGIRAERYDLVLWTRTRDLADRSGPDAQWRVLAEARRMKMPIIGLHLDRFWDLKQHAREDQIFTEPFFRVDLLFTADGGNQDRWASAGVCHRWLPPGVSERWCVPGMWRDQYASDIAFVGSWDGGYHREAQHRFDLVAWLDATYPGQVKFWPKRGEHAIRGLQLNDLYWSTKIVIGDSCLVPRADGSPITNYCSDRIPETMGRGGMLAHPTVIGINADYGDPFYPMLNWPLNDWRELRCVIDDVLEADPITADAERHGAMGDMRVHNTYEHRVRQIVAILTDEGLL